MTSTDSEPTVRVLLDLLPGGSQYIYTPAQLGVDENATAQAIADEFEAVGVADTIRELDLLHGVEIFVQVQRPGQRTESATAGGAA